MQTWGFKCTTLVGKSEDGTGGGTGIGSGPIIGGWVGVEDGVGLLRGIPFHMPVVWPP